MIDLLNAGFEFFAGLFGLFNVRSIYKAKKSSGVSILSVAFFTLWGYWNLYYYPSLGQWWSTIGAILMTMVNSIWLGQILYYRNKGINQTTAVNDANLYTEEELEALTEWQCSACGYQRFLHEPNFKTCPTCGEKVND